VLGDAYIGASVVQRHLRDAEQRFLEPDEKLLGVFNGLADSTKGGHFKLHDYLFVTDRRVIIWARGLLKNGIESFHYDDISSAEITAGLIFGDIILNIRGAIEKFTMTVSTDASLAEKMIRQNTAECRLRMTGPRVSGGNDSGDSFDKLERLASLKDQGLISEKEFKAKRETFLSEI
jgi:hypothetical protein